MVAPIVKNDGDADDDSGANENEDSDGHEEEERGIFLLFAYRHCCSEGGLVAAP